MKNDELDQQIDQAVVDVDQARAILEAARAHRERVTEDRVRTIGKIAQGDPVPIPDLDRLATEYVAASHALQDAQLGAGAARQALEALRAAKPDVVKRESIEHLRAVLALRAELAPAVERALDHLVATAELYLAAVAEANGTAKQLGVHENWTLRMGPVLARHVNARCRVIDPREFPRDTGPTPAILAADADIVRGLQNYLDRILAQ